MNETETDPSASDREDESARVPDEVFGPGAGSLAPTSQIHKRPQIARPMLFLALVYMLGLATGRWIALPGFLTLGPAAALAVLSAVSLFRTRQSRSSPLGSSVLLLAALGLLGWSASNRALDADRAAASIAELHARSELSRIEGRVVEAPILRERSISLVLGDAMIGSPTVAGEAEPLPLKATVTVRRAYAKSEREALGHEALPLQGSRVVAWGRVMLVDSQSSPGGFDRAKYLQAKGIGLDLLVPAWRDVEVLEGPTGWRAAIAKPIHGVRNYLRANINANLAPDYAPYALALLLGERAGLTDQARENFTKAGLAHLLSVSGLHTGFILLMAMGLARLFHVPVRGWAHVGITAVWIYAALVDFRPPVVRAATMGTFLAVGWSIGRTTSILAALATSALFTLMIDPRNLIRVDWQLSYACILSIAVLAEPLYERLTAADLRSLASWLGKVPLGAPLIRPLIGPLFARLNASAEQREAMPDPDDETPSTFGWFARNYIWIPFCVVLAVQIGILPLQASFFGEIHPISFIANILGVPLAFGVVLGAMLVGTLGAIPGLGAALGALLNLLLLLFQFVLGHLAGAEGAPSPMPAFSPLVVGLYYGLIFVGPHALRGEGPLAGITLRQKGHAWSRALVFFAFIIWMPILVFPGSRGDLEVHALDVGQGDALVLRFPNGKLGVVDGGGGQGGGRGKSVVAPFLRSIGARRIDFIVATHADADHIGGLDYLVDNFEVGVFFHGPDLATTRAFADLEDALTKKNVATRNLKAGDRLGGLGEVEVRVLNPADGQDNNDASVVLLLDHGEVEILLTGDIESPAERAILRRGLAQDVDVLKIAHHGSNSSTLPEFLEAFAPELALISVGRTNPFGHPTSKVLGRLQTRGIKVARTDEHGSVTILSDGERYRLARYRKE